MTTKKLKILCSAYACEPHSGSEPGIGWELVHNLSLRHEMWVITCNIHRNRIEEELRKHPNDNLHFIYFDLPYFISRWRTVHRLFVQLYYPLWHIWLKHKIKTDIKLEEFDICHHLTWGRCWMPSAFYKSTIPYIFGPVGGTEKTPHSLLKTLSFTEFLKEKARNIIIQGFSLLSSVRLSSRNASAVFATTPDTLKYAQALGAHNVKLLTNSAISYREYQLLSKINTKTIDPLIFVSIGRLLSWKGFHLGLKAFANAHLDNAEYWIIGEGKEKPRLEQLVRKLGIEKQVRFCGWVPREDSLKLLEKCHILVHPSFHDSGGLVCAEAMATGKPVICLNTGGPSGGCPIHC